MRSSTSCSGIVIARACESGIGSGNSGMNCFRRVFLATWTRAGLALARTGPISLDLTRSRSTADLFKADCSRSHDRPARVTFRPIALSECGGQIAGLRDPNFGKVGKDERERFGGTEQLFNDALAEMGLKAWAATINRKNQEGA
jgi:hypothetical protein